MNNRELFQNVFHELVEEGISVEVPVFGLSMFPFLLPGNIVRIENVELSSINTGDIIVFKQNEKLVLHRVVKLIEQSIITKGDSLIREDDIANQAYIIGKVVEYGTKDKMNTVNTFSFKLYSKIIIYSRWFNGYILNPLSIIWFKFFRRAEDRLLF